MNDSAIEYVHWDDPNELVYRLRLLDNEKLRFAPSVQ